LKSLRFPRKIDFPKKISFPKDYDALKVAFIEMRAKVLGAEALIEHLRLVIAKMKREIYGPRSERSQRLLDQLELQLEDMIVEAGKAKAEAERTNPVQGHTRRANTQRNLPDHLPRRRIALA
jgi:transposase